MGSRGKPAVKRAAAVAGRLKRQHGLLGVVQRVRVIPWRWPVKWQLRLHAINARYELTQGVTAHETTTTELNAAQLLGCDQLEDHAAADAEFVHDLLN
jgi:hypothetical protein